MNSLETEQPAKREIDRVVRPLISIITVSFNAADTIEQTILSVIGQDYDYIEYIIVDGASNDGTLDIISNYRSNIDVLVSEKDKGIFDAMNKALKFATGEWVSFMNCGDMFFNNTVLSDTFEGKYYDDILLLYGDTYLLNDGNSVIFKNKKSYRSINFIPVSHQSVFIRLSKHPEFSSKYKLAADHQIIYSMFKMNKCHYLDFIISKIATPGASSDYSLTRREKFLISWREGDFHDALLGLVNYIFGFFKQYSKIFLIAILPKIIFQKLHRIKLYYEQKL